MAGLAIADQSIAAGNITPARLPGFATDAALAGADSRIEFRSGGYAFPAAESVTGRATRSQGVVGIAIAAAWAGCADVGLAGPFAAALSLRAVFRGAAFDAGAIAAHSGRAVCIRSALNANVVDAMVARRAIGIDSTTDAAKAARAIFAGGTVLRAATFGAGSVATEPIGTVRVGTAFDAEIVDAAQSFRTVAICFATDHARTTVADLSLRTIGILTTSGADSIAADAIGAIGIVSAFATVMVDAEQSRGAITVGSTSLGTDPGVAVVTSGAILRRAATSACALTADTLGAVAVIAAFGAASITADASGTFAVVATFRTGAIAADALGAIAVLATLGAGSVAADALRAIVVLAAPGTGSVAADTLGTIAVFAAFGAGSVTTSTIAAITVVAAAGAGSVAADAIGAVGIRTAFDAGAADTMGVIRAVVLYAAFGADIGATMPARAVTIRTATGDTRAVIAVRAVGTIAAVAASSARSIAADAFGAIRIRGAFDATAVDAAQSFGAVAVRAAPFGASASIAVFTGRAVLRGAAASACAIAADPFGAIAVLAAFGAGSIAADAVPTITALTAFDTGAIAANAPGAMLVRLACVSTDPPETVIPNAEFTGSATLAVAAVAFGTITILTTFVAFEPNALSLVLTTDLTGFTSATTVLDATTRYRTTPSPPTAD